MNFSESLFGLPPVNKRRNFGALFRFLVSTSDKSKDDIYIYWRAFVWSFRSAVVIALVYLAAYFVNIDGSGQRMLFATLEDMRVFLFSAAKITTLIQVAALLPFYLLMLIYNLDVRYYNLYWWTPKPYYEMTLRRFIALLFILPLMIWANCYNLAYIWTGDVPVIRDESLFVVVALLIQPFSSSIMFFGMLVISGHIASYIFKRLG